MSKRVMPVKVSFMCSWAARIEVVRKVSVVVYSQSPSGHRLI